MSTIFFSVLFVLATTLLGISTAQESKGGSGLSISPTRTELSLAPGTADKVVVSLKNITSGKIIAKTFVNDFEPDNETNAPKLITDPEKKSAASISAFLSGITDIELEPGESKDITVDVSIPENAAPGGYYGALRFQAVPVNSDDTQSSGSEVSLTANLLSLVLIEVPGDIKQKVEVSSVKAYLNAKKGSFFTSKPNFVGVEIKNQGNSFVKPFGRVVVKNMSGKEIFNYELNNSDPRSNVLPESTRIFKDKIVNVEKRTINDKEVTEETSPITVPGRYTIAADVSYGAGGEVFTVTSSFWYLPAWFLFVLLGVFVGLAGLAFMLYKKFR
jgi:hypothetical protein